MRRRAESFADVEAENANAALRGLESPAMIRSSVVFPAPLRPSSATVEPGVTFEATLRRAGEIAVIFPDSGDFQAFAAALMPCPSCAAPHAAPLRYSIAPPSSRIPKVRPSTQYIRE